MEDKNNGHTHRVSQGVKVGLWVVGMLSLISIALSIFVLARTHPIVKLEADWAAIMVGAFASMTTILIAWQIYGALSIKRSIKKTERRVLRDTKMSVFEIDQKLSHLMEQTMSRLQVHIQAYSRLNTSAVLMKMGDSSTALGLMIVVLGQTKGWTPQSNSLERSILNICARNLSIVIKGKKPIDFDLSGVVGGRMVGNAIKALMLHSGSMAESEICDDVIQFLYQIKVISNEYRKEEERERLASETADYPIEESSVDDFDGIRFRRGTQDD